jgi:hypothetical protein
MAVAGEVLHCPCFGSPPAGRGESVAMDRTMRSCSLTARPTGRGPLVREARGHIDILQKLACRTAGRRDGEESQWRGSLRLARPSTIDRRAAQ